MLSKLQRPDTSATLMLPRPKRLSGLQCLQLLQQLAEDDSGNEAATASASDASESDSSTAESIPEVDSSSDSSSVTSDAAVTGQPDEQSTTSGLRGRGRARGSHGRGCRGRLSSNTAQHAANSDSHETYIGRDGTVWSHADIGVENAGRRAQQNVFREKAGPTAYASRVIKESSVSSAFKLLSDEPMLRHMKKCTEAQARRELSDESWAVSLEELDAVTAIVVHVVQVAPKDCRSRVCGIRRGDWASPSKQWHEIGSVRY